MFTERLPSSVSPGGLTRREFVGIGLGSALAFLGLSPAVSSPTSIVRSRTRELTAAEAETFQEFLLPLLRFCDDAQFGSDADPMVRGLFRDRMPQRVGQTTDTKVSMASTGFGVLSVAARTRKELYGKPRKAAADCDKPLTTEEATRRVRLALQTAANLPHYHGIGPHFVGGDAYDKFSTADWVLALTGFLCAAEILESAELEDLATSLYNRVNWQKWAHPGKKGLLRHGMDNYGKPIEWVYDKANCETLLMYLLAVGAKDNGLSAEVIRHLDPCWREVEGFKIASGHLGLFALEWALEFVPAEELAPVLGFNLLEELKKRVLADRRRNEKLARQHQHPYLWGDSPGDAPSGYPADGIMAPGSNNIMAAFAAVRACPDEVMELASLLSQDAWTRSFQGYRYGVPNTITVGHPNAQHNIPGVGPVHLAPDGLGIDIGSVVIAFVNALCGDVVRKACCKVESVARGFESVRRLTHV